MTWVWLLHQGPRCWLCRQPQAASSSGGSRRQVSKDVPKATTGKGDLGCFMVSRAVCVSVARGSFLRLEPLPMNQERWGDSGSFRCDSCPYLCQRLHP